MTTLKETNFFFPRSLGLDRCTLSLLARLILQVTGISTWIRVSIQQWYCRPQKAFDTVNHEILLLKREKYGVIGPENTWFASFPCSRMQFCKANVASSELDSINCRVPRGSCLGLLLFLIYINDLLCKTAKSPCMLTTPANQILPKMLISMKTLIGTCAI